MAEFASKGVAGSGLGLGIAGTALGLLGGNLGGILRTSGCGCSEDHYINRYEATLEGKIAALEADKKLLESTIYTNSQINDLRNYVDRAMAPINARLNAQDVYNASNTAAIACLQNTVGGITQTVVPITAVCPEPMKMYNSWTAPTTA